MHIKNKRGQSTLEYVLLVTAVVVVIILLLANSKKGGFQATLNSSLNDVSQNMVDLQGRLVAPYGGSNVTVDTPPPYSVNIVP